MATYDFGSKRHVSAKDSNLKVRMSIAAPPGGGKTFTLLTTAFSLLRDKPNPRILVGDTENRSASKYADLFPSFDVIELDEDHSPQCMKALIEYAEDEGYDALIIDNVSHEWNGKNGVLEQVDTLTTKTGKATEAWRQVTPHHDAFFQKILNSKLHFFAAFRSKMQVAVEKDERGKTVVRRLGMQPITRDGADYEFDVTSRMEVEGNVLIIEKSRCPKLNGKVFRAPSHEIADVLREWLGLDGAAAPAPKDPTGSETDGRASLLKKFRKIVDGDDVIMNNVLIHAKTPYISPGQTWADLSNDSLRRLLSHKGELVKKIAAVKQETGARTSATTT